MQLLDFLIFRSIYLLGFCLLQYFIYEQYSYTLVEPSILGDRTGVILLNGFEIPIPSARKVN